MYSSYSPYLSSSSSTLSASDAAALKAASGVLGGMVAVIGIVGLIIWILTIVAQWKIFTKAGEKGWKSIIPIYNAVTLFKIIGISPWFVLVYLAGAIPVVGSFIVLAFTIYVMYKLATAFGKDGGFTVGLVLLNTIFLMILAFGSAEYQLDRTATPAE